MSNKVEELQKQLEEALKDKRSQNALIEKAQVGLMLQFWEKERQRFDYADTAQYILQEKNELDIMLIMDKLVEWTKVAKDENKKMFTDLFLAILRIQNYVSNLETLNKHSVAKYIGEVQISKNTASNAYSEKLKYEQEIYKLNKEIESLKKENEFLSK
jgi:hypothetical protein